MALPFESPPPPRAGGDCAMAQLAAGGRDRDATLGRRLDGWDARYHGRDRDRKSDWSEAGRLAETIGECW